MKKRFSILFVTLVLITGCTYKEIPAPIPVVVDCTKSTFVINLAAKTDASNCDKIDGSFTIGATGGLAPYVFSLNGGNFQTDPTFSTLGPGYYTVIAKDANQCEKSIDVEISSTGSLLAVSVSATGSSNCLAPNGTITLTPSGGTRPYTFQLDTDPVTTDSTFSNLAPGFHRITMRDNSNPCLKTVNVEVPRLDTGTSFDIDIKPIINTNCAVSGCHNGDTGPATDWSVFANVKANAQNIKTRTGNRSMPLNGSLTQSEIDLIACWVNDGAKAN